MALEVREVKPVEPGKAAGKEGGAHNHAERTAHSALQTAKGIWQKTREGFTDG